MLHIKGIILLSEKTDFKIKSVIKDKDEHQAMTKGANGQQDTTFLSMNVSNIGAPTYIKQISTDLKWEIDSNTIVVGDFNTTLTSTDRALR